MFTAIRVSIYLLRKGWFDMSSTRDGNLGFGLTNFVQVLEEIDKALDERYVFPFWRSSVEDEVLDGQ